jgi:hypothetical protein
MELFTKLFGAWLVFVYHCFDRVVVSGYLMGLQRPGQVVYWLQQVLGIEAITLQRRWSHSMVVNSIITLSTVRVARSALQMWRSELPHNCSKSRMHLSSAQPGLAHHGRRVKRAMTGCPIAASNSPVRTILTL